MMSEVEKLRLDETVAELKANLPDRSVEEVSARATATGTKHIELYIMKHTVRHSVVTLIGLNDSLPDMPVQSTIFTDQGQTSQV